VSHGVVVLVGPGGEALLSWSAGLVEVSHGVVGGGVGVSHGVVELTVGGIGGVSQDVLVSAGGFSISVAGLVEPHVVLVGDMTSLQSGTGISSSELTSMILSLALVPPEILLCTRKYRVIRFINHNAPPANISLLTTVETHILVTVTACPSRSLKIAVFPAAVTHLKSTHIITLAVLDMTQDYWGHRLRRLRCRDRKDLPQRNSPRSTGSDLCGLCVSGKREG